MTIVTKQTFVHKMSWVYSRQRRVRLILILLMALFALSLVMGISIGAVSITPTQLLALVLDKLSIEHNLGVVYGQRETAVFFTIRLPRVLLGALVGAGLGVSGASIQGIFRNPLAAPGLIGISSGSALAAVIVIVFGTTFLEFMSQLFGLYTLPLAAFVGGVCTTFIIYRLSTLNGRTQVTTMLLAGIAINALAGAAIGFMTFIATDEQLRSITFWSLGSLGGATWRSVSMVAPFLLLPIFAIPFLARSLNALLLGESEAGHLGINVETTKRVTILLVALAVGAGVSVTGAIGFVGLVVPHLLRLLGGPDHRLVLLGSALLGASLLLWADLLARTIAVPAEVPIGILTAMLGGPFFLWLLLKQRHHLK